MNKIKCNKCHILRPANLIWFDENRFSETGFGYQCKKCLKAGKWMGLNEDDIAKEEGLIKWVGKILEFEGMHGEIIRGTAQPPDSAETIWIKGEDGTDYNLRMMTDFIEVSSLVPTKEELKTRTRKFRKEIKPRSDSNKKAQKIIKKHKGEESIYTSDVYANPPKPLIKIKEGICVIQTEGASVYDLKKQISKSIKPLAGRLVKKGRYYDCTKDRNWWTFQSYTGRYEYCFLLKTPFEELEDIKEDNRFILNYLKEIFSGIFT